MNPDDIAAHAEAVRREPDDPSAQAALEAAYQRVGGMSPHTARMLVRLQVERGRDIRRGLPPPRPFVRLEPREE